MNQVILHLRYLLCHHDCVVVPGLGAFVNQYIPAQIDEETLEFLAPRVAVAFNSEINYNDGMIADSIARRDGISRDAAMHVVTDQVKTLRYHLECDREISLDGIGTLRFIDGVAPEFIPEEINLNNEFVGLNPISISTGNSEKSSDADDARSHRILPFAGLFRVAACFIAVLMVVTLFLHYSPAGDEDVQYASINSGLSAYTIADAIWGENLPEQKVLYFASPSEKEVAKENPAKLASELKSDNAAHYQIIVASFFTREQAESFCLQNPGYKLQLLSSDGKYRVSAAALTSLEEAMAMCNAPDFKDQFSQAWVLKQ